MGTNALINVREGNRTIVSVYLPMDGKPEYVGAVIKDCIGGSAKFPEDHFRTLCREDYLESLSEDERPTSTWGRVTMHIPHSARRVQTKGILVTQCYNSIEAMATRLIAGLFNDADEGMYSSNVQIATKANPRNTVYHYDLTLKNDRHGFPRPYLVITYGFEGEIEYQGFVSDQEFPEDIDEDCEVTFD